MANNNPSHCRAQAYDCLSKHLPELDSTRGLLRCAVAISMHELQRVDLAGVESQIDQLVKRVSGRLKSQHARAVMAHMHEVLFEERGFKGNKADYHNPRNSYLPIVLRTGRGLPISLSLLYKCVAEPLGVTVEGINAPGHFMVAVIASGSDEPVVAETIIDPFHGGRMLSKDEAVQLSLKAVGGQAMPDNPLAYASHRQWLLRMLQNLVGVFERLGQRDDMAAMLELRDLVLSQTEPAD